MKDNTIVVLFSLFLIHGCFSTKLPESVTPFRLNTKSNDEFRLGYLVTEPEIKNLKNKKPKSLWFENYDNYAKFSFHIIEDYRPSEIKEQWDKTVYSMLIREGADSAEIVSVPSVYRDTTVTLYYPIKKKADLNKINRCYNNGMLLLVGSFSKGKEMKSGEKYISELYNFHPNYLDSLTPASVYMAIKTN